MSLPPSEDHYSELQEKRRADIKRRTDLERKKNAFALKVGIQFGRMFRTVLNVSADIKTSQ